MRKVGPVQEVLFPHSEYFAQTKSSGASRGTEAGALTFPFRVTSGFSLEDFTGHENSSNKTIDRFFDRCKRECILQYSLRCGVASCLYSIALVCHFRY